MKTPNVTVTAMHIDTSDPDAAATEFMNAIRPIVGEVAARFDERKRAEFITYLISGFCGLVSGVVGRESAAASLRALADYLDELQRAESTRRPN